WLTLTVESSVGSFATFSPLLGGAAQAWRAVLDVLDATIVVGAGALAAAGLIHTPSRTRWPRGLGIALVGAVATCFAFMIANSVFIDFQPQGRYLLVAAPAMAALCVAGAWRVGHHLPRVARRGLFALVTLSFVALDAIAFETLHQLAARVA
ncbi:MAG: hypothetical protein ACYDC2_13465, partial [Solirubrobacteraceae bacterium]